MAEDGIVRARASSRDVIQGFFFFLSFCAKQIQLVSMHHCGARMHMATEVAYETHMSPPSALMRTYARQRCVRENTKRTRQTRLQWSPVIDRVT